jgi:TolB-like protein
MYTNRMKRYGIVLIFLVFIGGCGSTVKYINPSANFSYIKKIAVLPFNNFSDDRYAGEKVRNTLIVDLMSRGVFEVVEQGEVTKVLSVIFREAGVEEGKAVPIDIETLKLIGEKLGVQAVILGSVDEYSGAGGGNIVSIGARMLDTGSGIILWQAKTTETGKSVLRKLFGIDEIDRSELTKKVVKGTLDTLL